MEKRALRVWLRIRFSIGSYQRRGCHVYRRMAICRANAHLGGDLWSGSDAVWRLFLALGRKMAQVF